MINPAELNSRECLISELSGSRFWCDGPKFLWEILILTVGDPRPDDPDCLMDALLDSDKVCLLVQEISKTDLKFMRLEKYNSYIFSTHL